MRRFFFFCFILVLPVIAFGHPMGNFSINHYSKLMPHRSGLEVDYTIDMAEIPTFQEMQSLDTSGDKQISEMESHTYASKRAEEFVRNLQLLMNGKQSALQIQANSMKVLQGAAGLPTLMLRFKYFAEWRTDAEKISIRFRDLNFPERLGWKEVVLSSDGVSVEADGVSFVDRSKELTQYPADPTISAPQETSASFQVNFRGESANWNESKSNKLISLTGLSRKSRDDRFTKLISTATLSGRILALSLLIAFALGAMHAMSPGHGKTIVAGYLVGSRGTAVHAIFLGAVVTLTHTIGVFLLGLITLYGSRYILPEHLYPWLGFASGVSIVLIGVTTFRKRWHALRHARSHHHEHKHEHDHDHDHDHSHGHSHLPVDSSTGAITWRSLLAIGISGGALPCPSALVVLLSAISLHRIGFGLLLIIAFSFGLATVLTGIGLLLVYAAQFTRRIPATSPFLLRMPLFSSLIISVLGFAIAIQSVMQTV